LANLHVMALWGKDHQCLPKVKKLSIKAPKPLVRKDKSVNNSQDFFSNLALDSVRCYLSVSPPLVRVSQFWTEPVVKRKRVKGIMDRMQCQSASTGNAIGRFLLASLFNIVILWLCAFIVYLHDWQCWCREQQGELKWLRGEKLQRQEGI
jgi:hypothetical protein